MPPSVPDHHQALPLPPPGSASPRRCVTPQSPLRIKQDGKFYERLLTKEASAAPGNLSFRYYWADQPGSVPFVWETQPGTPKDVAGMAAGAVPAITPPPAYLLRHGNSCKVAASHAYHQQQGRRAPKSRKRCRLRRIRIGFIAGIFRRLSLRKAWAWRRPVEVSSSSRWLFCSAATERGERDHDHDDDVSAARQEKPVLCSSGFRARPTPWLLRFRGAR